MVKEKDDFEEEEEEEIEEEIEEEPKKKLKLPAEVIKKGERFVVFHNPERTGIIDMTTKQPVAEDTWSLLCLILNKIQRIDEAVG